MSELGTDKKAQQAEIADRLDQAIEEIFMEYEDVNIQEQSALMLNLAIKNIMFETNALVASEVVMGSLQSWIAFARHMAGFRDPDIETGEEGEYDFHHRSQYEVLLMSREEDAEIDDRLINLDERDKKPN
jgi:hypothetical protein